MKTFLSDATDFTDMDVKVRPDLRTDGARMTGDFVLCPKCHGYGGWNLELDAYPGPDKTPDQRHFRASCFQCHGWGWATVQDATCIHEYQEVKPSQPWRCWHTYRCAKCGREKSVDSSD